jgi:2-dehydro-3-deoxygluconokinase
MFDVLTIGETMILLEPVEEGSLKYVSNFKKKYGGAESNVAIGLTRLGSKVGWVSGVHDDPLGDFLISSIRGEGIDTSRVVYKEDTENAMYIKERTRPGVNYVYYYRTDAATSRLTFEDLDLEYLKQTKIIHLTGIMPMLSENCLELVQKVMKFAKEENILISFDPNLRHKLMKKYPNAKESLLDLCLQADILLPGLDEAIFLTGLTEVEEIMHYFKEQGVQYIVIKDGEKGAYYLDEDGSVGKVESFKVDNVVDPIGAGDGFGAGVLNGLLNGLPIREAVEQGALIGSFVVQVKGDIEGLPTLKMLEDYKNKSKDVTR